MAQPRKLSTVGDNSFGLRCCWLAPSDSRQHWKSSQPCAFPQRHLLNTVGSPGASNTTGSGEEKPRVPLWKSYPTQQMEHEALGTDRNGLSSNLFISALLCRVASFCRPQTPKPHCYYLSISLLSFWWLPQSWHCLESPFHREKRM